MPPRRAKKEAPVEAKPDTEPAAATAPEAATAEASKGRRGKRSASTEPAPAKKAKAAAKKEPKADAAAPAAEAAPASGEGADVHITSSKACQAFKRTSDQLQKLLLAKRPGTSVSVDEQKKLGTKPDRGSFIVRVRGKELVKLEAMPRPFTAMKALDLAELADKVASELA